MNVLREWPYYLGAVGALGFVAWLVARGEPLGIGREVTPGEPPPPPGGPLRWIELDGPKVGLFNGDRYRACVDVPFGLGWAVSEKKIIDGALKMGFRDVVCREDDPPPGWHSSASCDYFVEAVWGGEDKWIERPGAVTLAWRLSRA